jgi:peptidoglycan/LPS O-acetylase OafA/YrhL
MEYGNIPKNNNFDLIRLLLSLMVFLVHSYELSKNPGLSMIPVFLNTHTAVCAFFVISGFLVSSSFANSTTPAEYFSKRIRRVFPGYVVVVLLCGLAGVAFSEYSYREYFSFPLLRYLGANLSFLNFIQPSLPGVFIGNSSPFVNGALWTIRLELLFYLSVPMVFMLLKRFRKSLVFLFMFGIALISRVIFDRVAQNQPDNLLFPRAIPCIHQRSIPFFLLSRV